MATVWGATIWGTTVWGSSPATPPISDLTIQLLARALGCYSLGGYRRLGVYSPAMIFFIFICHSVHHVWIGRLILEKLYQLTLARLVHMSAGEICKTIL